MAGVIRPAGKVYVNPQTGRITLEFDAFLSALINAVNAVSQGSLVATKSYTVATVPSAATEGAGRVIYVSDEAGGAVLAFSDGTDWRRVTDRNVIS
jgi:hypothetical protein